MEDYHVDRPGVEGEQSLKLTGTNRPDTLITLRCRLALKVLLYAGFRRASLELRLAGALGIRFLAPIAAGFHPFPSRTRQLRPPAPMVVGPQGPSRVGQRQIIRRNPPQQCRRVPLFRSSPAARIADPLWDSRDRRLRPGDQPECEPPATGTRAASAWHRSGAVAAIRGAQASRRKDGTSASRGASNGTP